MELRCNLRFCETEWPEDGRLTVETCSCVRTDILLSKVIKKFGAETVWLPVEIQRQWGA
jgi:hypothetical protein